MKVTTPEISWHERDPIYSVDFQPGNHAIQRVASGGVDKIVRIWQMIFDSEEKGNFEFLSNLRRHTATVNVVRFSKDGELLASAGDDSSIIVWNQSDVSTPANNIFAEDDTEESKESWVCYKTLRGHLGDVADMSWSKDSRFLVSGSVDNTAIVWNVKKAQKMAFFNEHKSYVQGVAFDPLGDYIATLSSDRSMRIFSLATKNTLNNVSKMPAIAVDSQAQPDAKPKSTRIFQDDSLRSFFRRLEFTADGQLLLTPAGCVELGDKMANASFVFVRGAFARPALYLPSGDKSTTVVRANPQLFELRKSSNSEDTTSDNQNEQEPPKSLFNLPYRTVFAVATEDSVLLYDTQQKMPVGLMKNIHYHQISDLSWSPDGKALIISSTDGFCTIATFDDGELGIPYRGEGNANTGKASEAPSGDAKINGKENQEEKEGTTDITLTRCMDDASKTSEKDGNNKAKEINTKLNIRRVSKSPGTPDHKGTGDKSKANGTSQVVSPAGSQEGTKSSPSANGKAKGINTSLNIRRVPKGDKSPQASTTEDGASPQGNETTSTSSTNRNKDPKINTILNIRRVGKDGNAQSVSPKAAGKSSPEAETESSSLRKESPVNTVLNIRRVAKDQSSQPVSKLEQQEEGMKCEQAATSVGQEKEDKKNPELNVRVEKNENPTDDCKSDESSKLPCVTDKETVKMEEEMETDRDKDSSSTLPDKVKDVCIEDVVMEEVDRESESGSKIDLSQDQ